MEERELAALGTLAANLAHEIRNPLNSINLNLEMVEEDLELGGRDSAATALGDTRTEVNRLGRLVTDFLTYARPSKPRLEPIDLADLVDRVQSFLAAEARTRGVRITTLVAEPHVEVLGDAGQLRQLLMNLVLNAIQAVEEAEPVHRLVGLSVSVIEDTAVLSVTDEGHGVPEDELERIREAFFTKRRGGSGLGLAIAERVVRSHGGHLSLANRRPLGFEARVGLPLFEDDGKMSVRSPALAPENG